MGDNVHISRRVRWTDPAPDDITHEEWRDVAESDADFEECGETTYDLGRTLIENDSNPPPYMENVVVYACYGLVSHPDYPSFNYLNGRVNVRGPDDRTLLKMFEVADRLGAVVQGDDGEFYRPTGRDAGTD